MEAIIAILLATGVFASVANEEEKNATTPQVVYTAPPINHTEYAIEVAKEETKQDKEQYSPSLYFVKTHQNWLNDYCNTVSKKDKKSDIKTVDGKIATFPIFFKVNSAIVSPTFNKYLKMVADFALKNNGRIVVVGYTDNQGGITYNQGLAYQRIQSVKKKLISLGMDEKSIGEVNRAKSGYISDNKNENKVLNRRVEVYILLGNEILKGEKGIENDKK